MAAFKHPYVVKFWEGLARGEPAKSITVQAYSQLGAHALAYDQLSLDERRQLTTYTATRVKQLAQEGT